MKFNQVIENIYTQFNFFFFNPKMFHVIKFIRAVHVIKVENKVTCNTIMINEYFNYLIRAPSVD